MIANIIPFPGREPTGHRTLDGAGEAILVYSEELLIQMETLRNRAKKILDDLEATQRHIHELFAISATDC